MPSPRYEDSVFINCPFDPDYSTLFPALVFAVVDCGFAPRCALERSDSGETRIDKLYRLIETCQYGIHDLSRTEPGKNSLPRFNMPLELGIFLGAKRYGRDRQGRKVTLILDRSSYRYQKFCSDLGGSDPKAHGNRPRRAIIVVRNWLRATVTAQIPGGEEIHRRYRAFNKDLEIMCPRFALNRNALEFNDLTFLIAEWLKVNPPP